MTCELFIIISIVAVVFFAATILGLLYCIKATREEYRDTESLWFIWVAVLLLMSVFIGQIIMSVL